jgi:bacterioferritin
MTHRTFVELIAGLDGDLAREYAAVVQNRTYASLVRGPHRPALRRLLAGHAARDLAHASLLADMIAALGGVPTVRVAPVAMAVHETELQALLRRLLDTKTDAVERYTARRARRVPASGARGAGRRRP